MNTSNPNRQVQLCSGRLPTFWEDPVNFAKWPPPYYPTTSKEVGGVVASQFHDTGCSGGAFGNRTMVEVLSMSGQGGYADLGAHVVAALLNAASDLTPVLSVSQVLDLWNECSSRGYYEPTAGVQWGPDQLVAYLQSTMPG